VFATETGCAFCEFGAKLNMLDSTAVCYTVAFSFCLSLFFVSALVRIKIYIYRHRFSKLVPNYRSCRMIGRG
jgi:hypothetical protein